MYLLGTRVMMMYTQAGAAAAAAGEAAASPGLDGLQQQDLQIEARLHFYDLMKEQYDTDNEGKSVKQLAKKPALTHVKQVGDACLYARTHAGGRGRARRGPHKSY
jgi:hypothetical protein